MRQHFSLVVVAILIFETTARTQNGCVENPLDDRYLLCTKGCLTIPQLPLRGTQKKRGVVSKDINILALAKGEERYIFLYNDQTRNEALRTLGRYASNSELSFSWYDAAVMSQKVRKATSEQTDSDWETAVGRFEALPVEDLLSGEEPLT